MTRVVVEQSAYALTNLGDRAMLEEGVLQLRTWLPDAEIAVVTSSPETLARIAPGVRPVRPFLDLRRYGLAARVSGGLDLRLKRNAAAWRVYTPELGRLLDGADLVVSTGGGFLTDAFRHHASGVLTTMRAATARGIPTAMLGQGIGPLRDRRLLEACRQTLPALRFLGARVPVDPELERTLRLGAVRVTGDDVFMSATRATTVADGDGLGFNVRTARYANTSAKGVAPLQAALTAILGDLGCEPVSVPIETHGKQRDGIGIREVVGPTAGRQELHSTAELREQVRRCRTVVTGSYHAAVFALAAGVPVVCLSKSSYYDQKFSGLAALMPAGAVTLVRLSEGTDGLAPAVASAWELGRAHREAVLACARELGTRSQDLWREVCASLN